MSPGQGRIAEYRRVDAERPFLDKAFAGALGDEDRLRYAQIVEAGDPERAEWLRLEVDLHSRATADPGVLARFIELAHRIGLEYAELLLRARIMNCGSASLRSGPPRVRFAFACSKRWETLAPTEVGSERYCQQCKERVYYCDSVADAETRALAGQCIAVPKQLADERAEPVQLGRPSPGLDWGGVLFTLGPGARDSVHIVVIYSGESGLLGRCFTLRPAAVTTVGRGADRTIVLQSDAASRSHARFERRADAWWVVDEGSTNGTHVNGERVREAALRPGDHVQLGGAIFKLVDGPAAAEPAYTASTVDGLTGLANRRQLREQIDRALQDPGGAGRAPALALFDLDRFKAVNDQYGHLAGDRVLCEVAGLMRAHVRAGAVLARHAGDRFALLLPAAEREEAATIAAQIQGEIAGHAFAVDGHVAALTVSVGVACAGEEVRTADALIHAAEQDLDAARRR